MDIKFLYIISTFNLLVTTIVLFINYKKHSTNNAIKFLTYFISVYTLGFILFILRNQIPDFFSIVVANSLLATGLICTYVLSKAIAQIEPLWHNRYFIPLITYIIGFLIFTYINYDTKTRIYIYYFFCALFLFPTAWTFWNINIQKYKIFDKITSLLFFVIALILVWILIQVNFIEINTYYFNNENIFMILSIYIINILSIWSLITLKYRIKR